MTAIDADTGAALRTFDAMPTDEEIRAAVLGTSFRPSPEMPSVVKTGCQVVLNVHGLVRGLNAAAVYYQPPRVLPSRIAAQLEPRHGALVVVGAVYRADRPHSPDWLVGVVGETTFEPPAAWCPGGMKEG